jgi:molecular chaperone DnaK
LFAAAQGGAGAEAGAGPQTAPNDGAADDVVDAEFTEVKDDKK